MINHQADEIEIELTKSVFLEVYHDLLEANSDIDFLWGGRDSGKSTFLAMILLVECMTADYFRCILIKKTYASIQDAQWQALQDLVYEWGLEELFTFKKSPLEIVCVNGNKFIARGCDTPAKLKSISNPTCAWFEEGNQLSREEYIVIATTLRSSVTKVKQYFSFNPEADGDYKDHWLWPYFAEQYKKGVMTFQGEKVVELPKALPYKIKYTSTHTTYHDNKYCSPERQAMLEELKNIDPYYYDVFTLGLWGNKANERPFVTAYRPEKHDGYPELNRSEIVYLSFDFNVNPMCCSVIQHYDGKVRVLRTIKLPNSDIYEMCDHIKAYYPKCRFIVTGDASGASRQAISKDNLHYYMVIQQKLGLEMEQLEVPNTNPGLEDNRMVVNAVLATYPVEVHVDDARSLLYDFRNAQCRPDGTLVKGDREDETQQLDALDTWRYFCNSFMLPYVHLI